MRLTPIRRAAGSLLLPFLIATTALAAPPVDTPGMLRLSMLDVGQGEALYVEYPDGSHGLIDSGGRPKESMVGPGVKVGMLLLPVTSVWSGRNST